jgi:hypothetical protein
VVKQSANTILFVGVQQSNAMAGAIFPRKTGLPLVGLVALLF